MNFSVPFPALGLPTRALTAGDVRSAAETGRNAPASVGTPVLCPSATLSSPSFGAAVETPRTSALVSARTSYAPRAGVASPPFGAIRAHALPGTSQTAMSSSHAASNPVKLLSACFFFIQTLPFFSFTSYVPSVSLFEISSSPPSPLARSHTLPAPTRQTRIAPRMFHSREFIFTFTELHKVLSRLELTSW